MKVATRITTLFYLYSVNHLLMGVIFPDDYADSKNRKSQFMTAEVLTFLILAKREKLGVFIFVNEFTKSNCAKPFKPDC